MSVRSDRRNERFDLVDSLLKSDMKTRLTNMKS